MQVVIIGGTGFIGEATARALLEAGHGVRVLARNSPGRPLPGVAYQQGDYGDIAVLERALEGMEAVLHLGLRVPAQAAAIDDASVAQVLAATAQLLAMPGLPRFVYASSAAVYGAQGGLSSEAMALPAAQNAYGRLMQRVEAMAAGHLGLRYFNVYGWQRRREGGFVNFPQRALEAGLSSEELVIHGDGEARRDFVAVEDVARANLLALASREAGVVNVGSGEAVSLNALTARIEDRFTLRVKRRYAPEALAGVAHSQAELRQVQMRLGFCPAIGLDEGLTRLHAKAAHRPAGAP